MKNILSILIAFILLNGTMTAQQADCLKEVRDIYAKLNRPVKTEENTVNYLNFTVKTTLRNPPVKEQSTSVSDVELFVSARQCRYISKDISFYEDEKEAFTVIPSRKTIYRKDSNMNLHKEKREDKFQLLQDTLFSMCVVSECIVKDNVKIITLIPNTNAKIIFEAEKLTFFIDNSTRQIKKILVDYSSKNNIKNTEIIYNKIDFNYQLTDVKKPVAVFFVDKKSQLTAAYKGYELIDIRKKKG